MSPAHVTTNRFPARKWCGIAALLLLTAITSRAVTEKDDCSDIETHFDANISTQDLAHNRPITSTVSQDQNFRLTGINDGLAVAKDPAYVCFFGSGGLGSSLLSNPQVTIRLDTVAASKGYSLNSITSIYGWQNYDQSFSDQNYAVSYSTVTAPGKFIPLAAVNYHPFNPTGRSDKANSSKVDLTDLPATGVAAVRFTFSPYSNGVDKQGGQMIREINIFGSPTSPAQGTPLVPEGCQNDIAPLKWTAAARSDWISVVSFGADPSGKKDSSSAIQAALDVNNSNLFGFHKTIYFPAGTYNISSTLKIKRVGGYSLIGCGSDTIIKWCGAMGSAMIWTDSVENARYLGLVWEGNNRASCAYEDYNLTGYYGTQIRHENEAFRNFNQPGNYISGRTRPLPPAGIIGGLAPANVTGEMNIINCSFYNCSTGVYNALDTFQYYMWFIEGCEFEDNGVGFDGGVGGCYVVTDTHFKRSSWADIVGGNNVRCHRLTSSGSGQFFCIGSHGGGGINVFEDCFVDGWTNPGGALTDVASGADLIMDCTFTAPPANGSAPVEFNCWGAKADVMLSINTAASSPGVWKVNGTAHIVNVPAGSRGKNITTAAKIFIESRPRMDSAHIIDVTRQAQPFNADNSSKSDCTAAIQHAISAAEAAHNGTIVYLPAGFYKVSSPLKVSGGNYKIQGTGFQSQFLGFGASGANVFAVSQPQRIKFEQFQISVPDVTTAAIYETSAGASNIIYDSVWGTELNANYGASGDDSSGLGIVLSKLSANSKVSIPVLNSPLSAVDCGPAQILVKMGYMGNIRVSGATRAKTGFLGMVVAEGGQQKNGDMYNFDITDNQNLVVGSYYTEQSRNDVRLARGAGTTTGSVTILGLNSASGVNGATNPPQTMIDVDNYAGRFFYGETGCANNGGMYPVQITQTGTNAVDLITEGTHYSQSMLPSFNLASGAHSIRLLNSYGLNTMNYIPDTPETLTPADLTSLSGALDDVRQLGAVDLSVSFP
jgi:hypothetical protein